MLDCLLISPPSRMVNHYRPPLSLIHLGGYLTHKGLAVKIVDAPMKEVVRDKHFEKNKPQLLRRVKQEMLCQILNSPATHIGVSCYSPEYQEVKELVTDIRAISKAKIIVGGIHPTLRPEEFKGIADYVVQGIGETKLFDILTGNKTEWRELDEICYPDYSLVDMPYYTNANVYAIRGVFIRPAYIMASIGCPSSCAFCVSKTLRHYFGSGLLRSTERILGDMYTLKHRFGVDGFYFIDDLFTLNKDYVKKFCREYKQSKLKALWACSAKVTTLDEETIGTMADAGCIQMDFGVERGDDEELKMLKKGQTVAQIERIFESCKKNRIRTFANFLVNIPNEDTQSLRNLGRFAISLGATINSFNLFRGYLGTEIPDIIPSKETETFVNQATKRCNSFWRTLSFHLSAKYLRTVYFSKHKFNYLKQIWVTLCEIINQVL